jgi:pyrroloquinoline quinone biosynthesis protein B
MYVRILGTAAGGAFPQWNCVCRNCQSVRVGSFSGRPRSQLQVCVSSDRTSWFLLNASPDLRVQIESNSFLYPQTNNLGRHSPISGVILTSADVDQSLGLLLLRELQPLQIYCTAPIQRILREDNSMFAMLNRVSDQASWNEISADTKFELKSPTGETSGIKCLPVSVSDHYPAYVSAKRVTELSPKDAVIGLILEDGSGKRLGYFPAVGQVDAHLLSHFGDLDVLMFDGTFWSDDELIRLQGSGQTARQMGHLPISGKGGSLDLLSHLKRPRKMFVHINNTNPMLDESNEQYRQVYDAGWEIAEDGCQLEL